ncbi:MAG: DUF1800 family protein, partial [Candidatus Sulfotelmatobacter sp.]
MRVGRTKSVCVRSAVFLLCLSLACIAPQLLAKKQDQDKVDSSSDAQRRALHALNRLTFGPRPGDVQQVMEMGVEQWIDLQLHPGKIDDSALDSRLDPLRTLRMSPKEIAEDFPDGQEINQVMNGKKAMPSDPARRAVFQVQIARQQDKKDRKEESIKNTVAAAIADAEKEASAKATATNAAGDSVGSPAANTASNGAASDTNG